MPYFTIITNDDTLFVEIKIRIETIKESKKEMLLLNKIQNFVYFTKTFPLTFSYQLTSKTGYWTLNIRLIQGININQLFQNLNITSYYEHDINDNGIKDYNNEEKEQINVLIKPELDLAIISGTFSEKESELLIKIAEQNKTINITEEIEFQIYGYQSLDNGSPISLSQNKYFYNKINLSISNSISYFINTQNRNSNNRIEFALCSDGRYSFSLKLTSGEEIPKNKTLVTYENGKTTIQFYTNENINYIYFTISIDPNSVQEKEIYHMIKYTSIDQYNSFQTFIIDQLRTNYSISNKAINSEWGAIKNASNYNSDVKAKFYYYLFEPTKTPHNLSICILSEATFIDSTEQTFYVFTNETYYHSEYDNIVIASFKSYNEEEFMIAFKSKKVYITSGNIWVWVCLIFGVFILVIGFGTYHLQKEIKKREEEEEKNKSFNIEINSNNNNKLFENELYSFDTN